MNIASSSLTLARPTVRPGQTPSAPAQEKNEQVSGEPQEGFVNSAFSGKRDLAYAALSTLAQIPTPVTDVVGTAYGIPQGIATLAGGLMAAAGAREIMVNETLHGRVNGGVHMAVGLMTAAAPWSGGLSIPLYAASMVALGVKAAFDQPGNIAKTTATEVGSMAKELFSSWEPNSKV